MNQLSINFRHVALVALRSGLSLLLLIAVVDPSHAGLPFTEIVAFGDSSTDMGNRGIATNSNSLIYPHQTWIKQLAGPTMLNVSVFGPSGTNSWLGVGATNYAHGGATTRFTADLGLGDATGRNLTNQVTDRYLNPAWNSGGVRASALHTVFIGMNDINFAAQANPSAVLNGTAYLNGHANQVVHSIEGQIQALASAGVNEILWLNIPDMSKIPAVVAGAGGNATILSRFAAATQVYNDEFDAALSRIEFDNPSLNIVKFDLHSWFNKIIAEPGQFGLTNVTGGANQDNFLFTADRLHPTSHAHAIWSQAVYDFLTIPEPDSAFLAALALGCCILAVGRKRNWERRCRVDVVRQPADEQVFGKVAMQIGMRYGITTTLAICAVSIVVTPAIAEKTAATAESQNRRELHALTYVERDDLALKLDLYLPMKSNSDSSPLIVWIHGGGFAMGGRGFCPLANLTTKGYAVASISYRLSGQAKFPSQIEDCKAAVRWLRSHADQYQLSAERIGVCGESAGGMLAALLGTAQQVGDWGDSSDGVSSRVQAVVALCPPTDLAKDDVEQSLVPDLLRSGDPEKIALGALIRSRTSLLEAALGGPLTERREMARAMSPVTHVTKDDPPCLLIHGDRDRLIPLWQSEELHNAFVQVGAESELVIVPGAAHGFGRPNAELMAKINAFFDAHLISISTH